MSTGWDFVCKTHEPNITGGFDEGNDSGKEALRWTWQHRHVLAAWWQLAIDSGTADLDFPQVRGSQGLVWFVRQHINCTVALINEYGHEVGLHPAVCTECGQPMDVQWPPPPPVMPPPLPDPVIRQKES